MIRIENPNPDLGPSGFLFNKQSGVTVSKFDPGFPQVREVVDGLPQLHGTQDYTRLFGSRVVSIEFRIYSRWSSDEITRRQILDILHGLCNPSLRPYMYESIDGQDERRIQLRADNLSSPFEFPHTNMVQMSWVAPTGFWESGELQVVEIQVGGEGDSSVGRSYDLTYDRDYDVREAVANKDVVNDGNIDSYPVIVAYGPFTSMNIANESTGQEIDLPDYEIVAGESIVIDSRNRTIIKSGQPNTSLYSEVDWTTSSWFTLRPGVNQISFNATDFEETTKSSMAYRHNWI